MNSIHKRVVVYRPAPINLRPEDEVIFAHEYRKEIPFPGFRIVRNALVFGDIVFDVENKGFLTQHTHIYPLKLKSILKRLLYNSGLPIKIDKAVWIGNNWSDGYFHWMTDAVYQLVSNLEACRKHGPILLNPIFEADYIKESLELLGVSFIEIPKRPILVRNLLFAEKREAWGNYIPDVLKCMQQEFVHQAGSVSSGKGRYYLKRAGAIRRRLTNEDEIETVLLRYGVKAIEAEKLSFVTQVRIFSETELLVALHGAGLTNILFMPEGSNVMEIRNKYDRINNCYFSLAAAMGVGYGYHLADGMPGDNHANVVVDAGTFERDLQRLLNV
jgi:capsular polysaccharide biosynthesis protein